MTTLQELLQSILEVIDTRVNILFRSYKEKIIEEVLQELKKTELAGL